MKDEITVFHGDRRWSLEIRKRKDGQRTTIHDGWIEFRDDFQLKIGDVCLFTRKDDSIRKFTVQLIRTL